MHKLTVLKNVAAAAELADRLAAAGIEASQTQEESTVQLYVGGIPSTAVWIANKDDMDRAEEIMRAVIRPTPSARCPHCRYDLQGHQGASVCPECGKAIATELPDVTCDSCGEEVPGEFELCWNCGAEVGSSDQS